MINSKKTAIQEEKYTRVIKKYEQLMYKIAADYYLPHGNVEDLLQEARIALTRAYDSYDKKHGVPFLAYAALCIRRQLADYVKQQRRKKHQILNQSDSLEETLHGPPAREPDPESELLARETFAFLQDIAKNSLSELERKVLAGYLSGESYKTIARELDKTEKQIDNALSRTRKKIGREIDSDDLSLNSVRFFKKLR